MTPIGQNERLVLVLGRTGKSGRRIALRLTGHHKPVRIGSLHGTVPFDGEEPSTWCPALDVVGSAFISYYPDLAVPGAPEAV